MAPAVGHRKYISHIGRFFDAYQYFKQATDYVLYTESIVLCVIRRAPAKRNSPALRHTAQPIGTGKREELTPPRGLLAFGRHYFPSGQGPGCGRARHIERHLSHCNVIIRSNQLSMAVLLTRFTTETESVAYAMHGPAE